MKIKEGLLFALLLTTSHVNANTFSDFLNSLPSGMNTPDYSSPHLNTPIFGENGIKAVLVKMELKPFKLLI